MLIFLITSPTYSITWPAPPPVPIFLIIPNIISFGPTPSDTSPTTSTFIVLGFAIAKVWVASTCSTSDVPIPKAKAPNAPWVAV